MPTPAAICASRPRDADTEEVPASSRACFGVVVAGALLWQVYAVLVAWRNAPILRDLFDGLGGELPLVTRSFFASHRVWAVLPLLTAVLVGDVWRRRSNRTAYSLVVAGGSVLVALVLHAWLQEAAFRPMLDLLKRLG